MAVGSERAGRYDPAAVEAKWRRRWEDERTNVVDLRRARRPYYNLMMFPYPSAEGLHVGNLFAFVGVDVHGRFRRLQGWDVFQPIGFDAFGIHSENYALKVDAHPATLIPQNISRFRGQLRRCGLMVDWTHELSTTDAEYYRWTQWLFLKLYKAGLAVKKKAPVNWCPECKTVLANEQVIDGMCERHPETAVELQFLQQWFLRTTSYAQRLLDNLETLDWSESTRAMQANWIGRSEGVELQFATDGGGGITVFTTRPDTVFGATCIVLAPEHPLVDELTSPQQRPVVNAYRAEAASVDVVARRVAASESKTGVPIGCRCRNPVTGEWLPVWIADYVLMEYGAGAIMVVPAHDERDLAFARKMGLEIRPVVKPNDPEENPIGYGGWQGTLVSSEQFDGMECVEAARAITAWLEGRGLGRKQVQYRLHDWCISRQRYWGPPIPIIYCGECGAVPVPEEDLPVLLPTLERFRPDESGESPLARVFEWYKAACPGCGRIGSRGGRIRGWVNRKRRCTLPGLRDRAGEPAGRRHRHGEAKQKSGTSCKEGAEAGGAAGVGDA